MKLIIGNGSVEVVYIDPTAHNLYMIITLSCKADELNNPENIETIQRKANFAYWYLMQEGFIEKSLLSWRFNLAAVTKPA
jgi:hypothetical protein